MRKASVLFLLTALLAGCGKPSPPPIVEAQGIVLLDGLPLKGVEVRFVPTTDYGPEYIARAITDDSGRFQLTCKGQPGALACECQVLVLEGPLPPDFKGRNSQPERLKYYQSLGGRPLPSKYASLVNNELLVNVTVEQKEHDIVLTR